MFTGSSLRVKIAAGFSIMTIMLVAMVGFSALQIQNTQVITDRVATLRAPTARTGVVLLNGVNHSLAALRGWMLLGKDKFKDQRALSWNNIDNALAQMTQFSRNWTNQNNVALLKNVKEDFVRLRGFQDEIEAISHKPENLPASKILFQEAAPKAAILAREITEMIDLELKEPATEERKALLGMMADVRGTLGLSLGAIRAYLLSGDGKFKITFEQLWNKNERRFGDLGANYDLLTRQQRSSFDEFAANRKLFAPLPPQMFKIRKSQEWNLANHWLGTKAAPTAFKIKESLDTMIADQKNLMAADVALSQKANQDLIRIEWGLAAAGLIFSIFITVFLVRVIANPINQIVEGLRNGSNQVNSAAGQISTSSQSLAGGATEQAAALEETSASLQEIQSMTLRNTEYANNANNLMGDSKKIVNEGVDLMKDMVSAMDSIKTSSSEISKIIKVIEEIAFQTNLLALNAAVEAARAGDHGKGFAVVAEEVRNLAQRSAGASKDTSELIENAVNKAEEGGKIVARLSEALEGIMGITSKSATMVSDIANASNEQSQGVKQVSQAVSQMDSVTQGNAATAEESASASEELSAQATEMDSVVDQLYSLVNGSNGSNGHHNGANHSAAVKELPYRAGTYN
ncbi:MAG: methyl-accepting chemotaxis protein [Nitrospinota bacterium]|nr:methyl-accepting chemotaxis protein [Nitrospinota bacterium]